MSKNIGLVFVYCGALLALGVAGSGCGNKHTATTTITPPSGGSNGATLEFTPQQFAAALAATGSPTNPANFIPTSYAGSTVLKSPDLQGPNNVVIYDATYSGRDYAIDLSVFTGMTVQQAVAAYIQVQNVTGTMVLPNGKTLNVGWEPASAGSNGSAAYVSSTGSCGYSSGGSGGSVGSSGLCGGPVPTPPTPVNLYTSGVINVVFPDGTNSSGNQLYQDLGGTVYADRTATKDVDLQRADLQDQKLDSAAQSLSDKFQMSFESARQLAQIADKLQNLNAAGQISDEDRDALSNSALGVAGLSADDVNGAVAQMIKDGNQQAINALMDKAATNLGMPSSAGLRDQILPALGILIQ